MVYDPDKGCVRGEEGIKSDHGGCQPPFDPFEVAKRDAELLSDMGSLKFAQLRRASYLRATTTFKHTEGLVDWSAAEWSNAMAGECGEACNLTKKLLRDGPDAIDMEELGDEIADVVIYADLLATRLGLKLEDCVRRKFNKVSVKRGSDIAL